MKILLSENEIKLKKKHSKDARLINSVHRRFDCPSYVHVEWNTLTTTVVAIGFDMYYYIRLLIPVAV